MSLLSACIPCLPTMCVLGAKEVRRSWVSDPLELELQNSGPLENQPVLLTSEQLRISHAHNHLFEMCSSPSLLSASANVVAVPEGYFPVTYLKHTLEFCINRHASNLHNVESLGDSIGTELQGR